MVDTSACMAYQALCMRSLACNTCDSGTQQAGCAGNKAGIQARTPLGTAKTSSNLEALGAIVIGDGRLRPVLLDERMAIRHRHRGAPKVLRCQRQLNRRGRLTGVHSYAPAHGLDIGARSCEASQKNAHGCDAQGRNIRLAGEVAARLRGRKRRGSQPPSANMVGWRIVQAQKSLARAHTAGRPRATNRYTALSAAAATKPDNARESHSPTARSVRIGSAPPRPSAMPDAGALPPSRAMAGRIAS
eukprot:357392-Chlamydomonas_euryale.AAC.60